MMRPVLKLALLAGGVALALMPDRYLPDGKGVNVTGTFAGRPVEMEWPQDTPAPCRIALSLERGRCEATLFDARGGVQETWSAQRIVSHGQIEAGGKLRLVPSHDAAGRYDVRIGKFVVLGSLLPALRVGVLAACVAGMSVVLWRRKRPEQGLDKWRVLTAVAVAAFSGFVDCGHTLPLAHQFGLSGLLAKAVAVVPAIVSLAAIAAVAIRARRFLAPLPPEKATSR